MPLREDWKKAKATFETDIKGHLKPDELKKMKGASFGPALEKFDAGKDYAARQKLIPAVTKARDTYVIMLNNAEKAADADGKAAVKKLRTSLIGIYNKVQDAAQPPKPLGRAKTVDIFYSRNLAGGVRPKWMKMGAIEVKVALVVDEVADELLKSGEVGYTYVNFSKAVNDEINKTTDAFKATLEKIDASIAALPINEREDKIKEANEVLTHYKGIVEKNVNTLVDAKWAEFIQRREYLKDFTKMCKQDIAVGAITIATSTAAIALSVGTAALSLVAIAKAIVDIAITLDRMSRTCDAAEKQLDEQLPFVEDLVKQRAAARAAGEGQKLAKAGETLKEAASAALGKISSTCIKTVSATNKTAIEFNGKISLLEADGGKLYKKLQEFGASMPGDPKLAGPKVEAELKKLQSEYNVMEQQFVDFNNDVQAKIKHGNSALAYCAKAKEEDGLPAWTRRQGANAGIAAALVTTARVLYKGATLVAAAVV